MKDNIVDENENIDLKQQNVELTNQEEPKFEINEQEMLRDILMQVSNDEEVANNVALQENLKATLIQMQDEMNKEKAATEQSQPEVYQFEKAFENVQPQLDENLDPIKNEQPQSENEPKIKVKTKQAKPKKKQNIDLNEKKQLLEQKINKVKKTTKKVTKKAKKTIKNTAKKTQDQSSFNFAVALFKGSYIHNPVLTQIIGICPIVMIATSFSNAFNLFLMITMMLCVCEVVTSLLLKKVPRWIRVCIYTLLSAVLITPMNIHLAKTNPQLSSQIGIYLPLLCVNGLIVIKCEKFACKTNVKNSLIDAFATSIGYGVVAIVVAMIRELVYDGEIFGLKVLGFSSLPPVALAFVALVILGFLSAIHKHSMMKYFPNENADTFSMNSVFEKPRLSDDGISKTPREQKTQTKTSIRSRFSKEISFDNDELYDIDELDADNIFEGEEKINEDI